MALLVSKDQQDKGDHQAKLGKEVLLGHQVHLVRKENRAQVVQQDLMAQPAQMVPLDREELQDQWDPQVIEAILGTKEDQDRKDLVDPKDQEVIGGTLAQLVPQVLQDLLVKLAQLEKEDHEEKQALLALLGQEEKRDPVVHLDQLVKEETQVTLGQQEDLDLLVHLDQQDPRDLKDPRETRVKRVNLAQGDLLDHLEALDKLVNVVRLVQLADLAQMANQGQLDQRDLQVKLDQGDKLVLQEILDL